jgi:multidrug efflux system outer membrane protein
MNGPPSRRCCRISRAAFFPQIKLTAETGVQSAALASLFGPGARFYTLSAALTQPIFDGFLLESQLKQEKGVRLQNLQAYRKAVPNLTAIIARRAVPPILSNGKVRPT